MSSHRAGKPEAIAWIKQNFSEGDSAPDVGCCDGKWSDRLEGYRVCPAEMQEYDRGSSVYVSARRVIREPL